MRTSRILLMVAALVAAGWWLSTHRTASDWRYLKLLVTQLPKMPFRYFV
jgi:hypothetical protein